MEIEEEELLEIGRSRPSEETFKMKIFDQVNFLLWKNWLIKVKKM